MTFRHMMLFGRSIMVKCYLSGTPECKFGLNDKLLLDNEAKARKVCMRLASVAQHREED